jgi:hypothetical protein
MVRALPGAKHDSPYKVLSNALIMHAVPGSTLHISDICNNDTG